MPQKKHEPGELIAIGGEELTDAAGLLQVVAERAGGGMLAVATPAADAGLEMWRHYHKLFQKLAGKVERIDIETRVEGDADKRLTQIRDAALVFFAGGDPLRITSAFGGSPLCDLIRERHANGLAIAGVAAGASAMSGAMLIDGDTEQSNRIGDAMRMAPGLGLLPDFVIDRHFARRGQVGRLLGAVAQNPRLIGVGIDANTAIVVRPGRGFEAAGEGAVYVVNGQSIAYTNLSESQTDAAISIHGVKLDVLSRGDRFDLARRAAARP